jgi:LysM repeat protein
MSTAYIVKPGDTLSKIARRNSVTLEKLLSLNPHLKANPNAIFPKQSIRLPDAAPANNIIEKKDSLQNNMDSMPNEVEIPMSPLLNMAKIAKFGSTKDLKYMQDAIDYLTSKAKAKLDFEDDEKEFLKEIYEAFWWGGHYKGLKEAAQLANNYVNGDGNTKANPFVIDSEVYRTSKIVIATMEVMKQFILEQKKYNRQFSPLQCDNPHLRSRPYAKQLLRMNYRTEGKMKSSGVLEAAQNNQRLHKTDGHFYLQAISKSLPNKSIETIWRVESLYDFEPFEKHDYYTIIPLGAHNLKLPDGLSEYMTKIGVAKAFWYKAEWSEVWEAN